MKKIILHLFIIAAFATKSFSQENYLGMPQENKTDVRDRWMLGFKLGENASNIFDTKGDDFSSSAKFGRVGGLFLAMPIDENIGIEPEILFSQKGFQTVGNMADNSFQLRRTTDFIDVPLLFQFKLSQFFTLCTGPEYSFLLKQKDKFTNSNLSVEQLNAFENNSLNKNYLGYVFGFDLNFQHFIFGVRSGWDATNNSSSNHNSSPQYKNVWLQASLGYRFYNNQPQTIFNQLN